MNIPIVIPTYQRPHVLLSNTLAFLNRIKYNQSDIFVVVGTSLAVYPAAGLIDYAPRGCPIFAVDPNEISAPSFYNIEFIKKKAGKGVGILKEKLLKEYV